MRLSSAIPLKVSIMRLAGQVALVTGGASGIGTAIVERMAADGARVMIADIDGTSGPALVDRIGAGTDFVALDIADAHQWTTAIARTAKVFGPLTCLVNNAGVSFAGSVVTTTEAAWRKTLDVNATGTFLGCQHAIDAMTKSGTGGTIINMASARGQRPSSGQIAYSASKALIIALTESIALYCGEQGLPIRCNAVCPGVIDTPILDEVRAKMGGRVNADRVLGALHLAGRLGRADEVASAVAYLASGEAGFITGTTINVDGGFRIRDR